MTSARVLLVEDDASIRRFVTMVLEDLGVELLEASTVSEALVVLRRDGPVQLLLTDLMMPGSSGFHLLEVLVNEPVLRGQARLAVMSAGLDADTLRRLGSLDVWRALRKPVSVSELTACVSEAVSAARSTGHRPGLPAGQDGDHVRSDAPAADVGSVSRQTAVDRHFGGDWPLFEAFQAASLAQFPGDIEAGDAAVRQADAAALRRVAHSLKSVLLMLGHDTFSALAAQLEDRSAVADWEAAAPLWKQVRHALLTVATR